MHHANQVTLVFITDLHHALGGNQLQAAEAVREQAKRLNADAIVCGGDFSENGVKSDVLASQREIAAALSVEGCPLLPTQGNHDDNSIHDYYRHPGSTGHLIRPEETYAVWFRQLEGVVQFNLSHPGSLYFFYDIPHARTRIISLNCIDIPYIVGEDGGLKYNGQWKYAFSGQQLNWMAHVALNFSDKPEGELWRVMVFSHVAILQEGVRGADHPVENGESMWAILQAYNNGSAYKSVPTTGDFAQSVEVDFTSQGPGQVVAAFFGHVHCDQAFKRDGIWMISTLNSVTHQEFEDCPLREVGTPSAYAFDLLTVDYAIGRLSLTRFGAGLDRWFVL